MDASTVFDVISTHTMTQKYDKVGYNKHNDVELQQSVDKQGSHTDQQTRGCRPSSTNPDQRETFLMTSISFYTLWAMESLSRWLENN